MAIEFNAEKKLGNFSMNASFTASGEVLALLGSSGCGKSTILKCISGIITPDRGKITINGKVVFDSENKIDISPQKRKTGFMFQNYALFPNMTVEQNILSGENCTDKREKKLRANEIMERFGLLPHKKKYPYQLSGGQQQRTALARILVSPPEILLLDEPFSALDSHLRFKMEEELRQVIRNFGKTVILVSHNRDEVYRLADKVAVLENGSIAVCGDKRQVFSNPVTKSSAILTGCKNISSMEYVDCHHIYASDWNITLETGEFVPDAEFTGVRMHDILPGAGKNEIKCNVQEVIENPFSFTVMLVPSSSPSALPFGMELGKDEWLKNEGKQITVHIPEKSILLLKK